jgi:hypothetical protein
MNPESGTEMTGGLGRAELRKGICPLEAKLKPKPSVAVEMERVLTAAVGVRCFPRWLSRKCDSEGEEVLENHRAEIADDWGIEYLNVDRHKCLV